MYFKWTLLLCLLILLCRVSSAQDENKTVTLTVSGTGITKEEAKTIALRSAIEQTYGVFISSNFTILNDSIIKDEIVSITNGNIQKFDVVNEILLADGTYAATLKVSVSVSRLTSFCESKGVTVDFKGGLFAYNIALQDLNEKNEKIAWENTLKVSLKEIPNCFSYSLETNEPKALENKMWMIPIKITINLNDNYKNIQDQVIAFSNSVSLSLVEREQYEKNNKHFYSLNINGKDYFFRNKNVIQEIVTVPYLILKDAVEKIKISNEVKSYSLIQYSYQNVSLKENDIRTVELIGNHNIFALFKNKGKVMETPYSILGPDLYIDGWNLYDQIRDNFPLFKIPELFEFQIGGLHESYLPVKVDFQKLNNKFVEINYADAPYSLDEIKKISKFKIEINR